MAEEESATATLGDEATANDEPHAVQDQNEAAAEVVPRTTRKVREGTVVSSSMDKTVVVAVVDRVSHPKYNKMVRRTKKLYAHDETNDANVGDKVRVMETRPLSKSKRWRITDVLERAK